MGRLGAILAFIAAAITIYVFFYWPQPVGVDEWRNSVMQDRTLTLVVLGVAAAILLTLLYLIFRKRSS